VEAPWSIQPVWSFSAVTVVIVATVTVFRTSSLTAALSCRLQQTSFAIV
jgi:hypothetical protein